MVAGILAAADHAEAAIAAAEPLVEPLAASLRDARHIFVTGGGLGYPAALEAALKLKEMALVHAEGAEAWEMTSGAATMLGPDAVVIALAPEGPARAALADLLAHAAEWGARTDRGGPGAPGRRRPTCCPSRRGPPRSTRRSAPCRRSRCSHSPSPACAGPTRTIRAGSSATTARG